MRKWINIAEVVVLVAMLVFVIGFHKHNNKTFYVKSVFAPKDFKWDGNLLDSNKSTESKDYKWFVISLDSHGKILPRSYRLGNPNDQIVQRIDPKSFLYKIFLSQKNKTIYDILEEMPNYKSFSEFIDLLFNQAVMPVHFINSQTKEIDLKRNDLIVFWNEINSMNKYFINHKEEIENDNADYEDYGYDLIYQNDKIYRIKFFRANKEGRDTVDFDYITKSGLLEKSTTTVIVK